MTTNKGVYQTATLQNQSLAFPHTVNQTVTQLIQLYITRSLIEPKSVTSLIRQHNSVFQLKSEVRHHEIRHRSAALRRRIRFSEGKLVHD